MKISTLSTLYHVGDDLLCLFVFFPSMVLYWRGIWDLWGYYLNSNVWALFGAGNVSFLGYLIQPALERYIPQKPRWLYYLLVRVYLFCFSAFLMCYWRGVWDTSDDLLGFELGSNLITYVLSYAILIVSRSIRSCIFPPMFTANDMSEDVLKPVTRFGVQVSQNETIMKNNNILKVKEEEQEQQQQK